MLPCLRIVIACACSFFIAEAAIVELKALPFPLSAIKLPPNSRLRRQRDANINWLLAMNESHLTCLYTSAANLTCSSDGFPFRCTPTQQQPRCTPHKHVRYMGHFLGHYLSATAMGFEGTGRKDVKARGDSIVATLAKVQAAFGAQNQTGLIFPYDARPFDLLFSSAIGCAPVCVPFYVMHKIFAGLLDQYSRAGNTQALELAKGLAGWVTRNVEAAIAKYGMAAWQRALGVEWGGMNEALYNLYAITGDPTHLSTGRRFNHYQWTAPLAIGVDVLDGSHGNRGGNHANTHLPEIVGTARGYELTGNATQMAIATNFFNILTAGANESWDPRAPGGHTFATGGSNAAEHWFAAATLADSLQPNRWGNYRDIGARTEESCTQYNVLKVARHLFQWSADAKLADFHERAYLNGILGNQNIDDADANTTANLEYFLPFGDAAMTKPWWSVGPDTAFPCCWGTLAEQFSKVADSIYFRSPDNATVFVNLFEPSTLQWDSDVELTQQSVFPASTSRTTTLTVTKAVNQQHKRTIALRVPFWATSGKNAVAVNGVPVSPESIVPSQYLRLTRVWVEGDTVTVHYPMELRFEQVDDPRPQFAGYGSILYGPLLLSGLTDNPKLIYGDNHSPEQVVVRNSTTNLTFVATSSGQCGPQGATQFPMVPLMDITGGRLGRVRYTTYFFTQAHVYRNTTAAGAKTLTVSGGPDFLFSGGASIISNTGDAMALALPQRSRTRYHHGHHHGHPEGGPAFVPYPPGYDVLTGNHYGHNHAHQQPEEILAEAYARGPVVDAAPTVTNGGVLNIRSGSPGQKTVATLSLPFKGAGTIVSVSFSYRFVIGYGTRPNSTGTSLSLLYMPDLDCPGTNNGTVLYTSPRYLVPSYDKCRDCYSDPVNVTLKGLALPTDKTGSLSLHFDNGDHNMQVLLPITFDLGWK